MNRTKTHFSRRARFFVVDDMTSEEGFDAYPVQLKSKTIKRLAGISNILDTMYEQFFNNPAPEECAQEEADLLESMLDKLFKEQA